MCNTTRRQRISPFKYLNWYIKSRSWKYGCLQNRLLWIMAEFTTSAKETSNRHLRFKLQSLGRRLDELEEATKNLQKAEDEVLDLQDKIIQAEGSNSSMLADVESLRKRVLKIEGKDEEVQKSEDMCRIMKEKLEEEENATVQLKSQIENLQKRMTELEKLEEAFSRSKNECTQLSFSLNEEKNVSTKLATDLESLRLKIKEMEASEGKFDKTEQHFVSELEKIKSFTSMFVNERKQLLEKDRQNEKLIQELKQTLEQNEISSANQSRNASDLLEKSTRTNSERRDLKIEDDPTSKFPVKESKRKSSLLENETMSIPENEKNKNQEDNRVQDLNQEIEKLRTQLNNLKSVEEELKQMNAKNNALHDHILSEQSKNKLLTGQLEKLKIEVQKRKELENGIAENEEIAIAGRNRNDKTKHRSETSSAKYKSREHSPLRRERIPSKDFSQNDDGVTQGNRHAPNISLASRRTFGSLDGMIENPKRESVAYMRNEVKKSKDQPSVLSRYPPAAQDNCTPKSWKGPSKPLNETVQKNRTQRTSKTFSDAYSVNTGAPNQSQIKLETEKADRKGQANNADVSTVVVSNRSNTAVANGTAPSSKTFPHTKKFVADSSTIVSAAMVASTSSPVPSISRSLKTMMNSEVAETLDTQSDNTVSKSSSKYPQHSPSVLSDRSLEDRTNARSELESRQPFSREPIASKPMTNPFSTRKFNYGDAAERITDVVQEKTASAQLELDRKGRYSSGETNKSATTYSNSTDSLEDVNPATVQEKRPCSPREAWRTRAIIQPAIIEKDLKEIMGGTAIEPLDSPKTMTSSITIYPSEPLTPRSKRGTTKERLTSTSNIAITPNDLSPFPNNIRQSFDFSINMSEITVTLPPATEKTENLGCENEPDSFISRKFSSAHSPETTQTTENNAQSPSETIVWKSHSYVSRDSSQKAKTVDSVKGLGQKRHSLSPLEERDKKTDTSKAWTYGPPILDTFLDTGIRPASRSTSAIINSLTAPDFVSRRSKSNLSASEFVKRRSYGGDSLSLGLDSLHRIPFQDDSTDIVIRTRKKQFGSSERLLRTDTGGRRQSAKPELQQDNQPLGSKGEERTYRRKYYPEEK